MTDTVKIERSEYNRLADIELEHLGCRMIREKDNAYLIDQRDILQTRIDRALQELAGVLNEGATVRARDILLGFS